MVYFWQKQSRRNRHSSPKTAISPLLSAATTAAETVLAAVVSGKSDKRSPSSEPASEIRASPEPISTSHSAIDEAVHVYRGSDDVGRHESGSDVRVRGNGDGGDEVGGGGGGEPSDGGSNPNMRTRLASSSSSCRGNSSVMTTKIQSLVLDKLSEYARRKQESNRRRVAERELDSLNLKIDKLLSKMDDGDSPGQGKMRLDEECVVCLAAPATMKTFPCGHRVVCRKCLIKTMQVAVSQRCLPLRCVICRNRILSLQHSQESDRSGAICLPDDGNNNNNNNNNINKYHSNYSSTATTTNNNNNNNFGNAIHGHHNSCYTNHNNSKIMRSNTTPTIHHSSSTPFKVSISSPSSPVSQQQAFVPVGPSHAHHFSSYHNAPSTSHGVPSNGGMFHRYHCVYPVQVHAAPLHVSHHASSSTPQKKSSNKCVKRLLGAR